MATLYTLAPNVARQLFDDDGLVLNGGLLYTKIAGTNTDAPTYQTSNGTLHANPIVLDSSGRITGSQEIYLAPGSVQDWTLKDSAGNTIWTKPGIGAVPSSSANLDIDGIAGESMNAGDIAYLSDGSGGLTPGSWYRGDADQPYSSTIPIMGFVVTNTTGGSTGTFRVNGQMTLTGPLTPGADYYVSTVAGAITATAPPNARLVGRAETTSVLVMALNPAQLGLDIFQVRAFL